MTHPVAIILGAAVRPDGSPSPALTRRAEHGAALFLSGQVNGIIASGGVVRTPPEEAGLIAKICVAAGVPPEAVQREAKSTTTFENLLFSKEFLAPDTPVVIVTDRYHAPRARLVAKRLGLKATTSSPSLSDAPPWRVAKASLREVAAYLWYLLKARQR